MTFEELRNEVLKKSESRPKWSRKGQFVFNYMDEQYGIARYVQFVEGVDCYYDDTQIDTFLVKCFEKLNSPDWEPFNEDPERVPDLPKASEFAWKCYYIPLIIRCGGIPKKDLIIGATYIGSCRNSTEAVWNGSYFIYNRCKFGTTYEDRVNHFEDDNGYDLFIPLKIKQK